MLMPESGLMSSRSEHEAA